jgi:hypothetical protein
MPILLNKFSKTSGGFGSKSSNKPPLMGGAKKPGLSLDIKSDDEEEIKRPPSKKPKL